MMASIQVGDVWSSKSQEYRCVGIAPHTRKDGSDTTLALVETRCTTCGMPFSFKLPLNGDRQQVSRRCRLHSLPGVRVSKAEMRKHHG